MSKILITGATGHLGGWVTKFLLEKVPGSDIAVLVRDKSKAADLEAKGVSIRVGDYENYDSLVKAFSGIDKLFFVSANDAFNREKQQLNVVKAAKEAGVKQVVYTSLENKDKSPEAALAIISNSHVATEEALFNSGLTYTILRNGLYADYAPVFYGGEHALATGTIFFPSGDGKIAFLTREEMAEIGANVLTAEGHENKIYALTGAQAYSFGEIAEMVSNLAGKPIQFISPTLVEFKNALKQAGVPHEAIEVSAAFAEATRQHDLDAVSDDAETLLGRPRKSFPAFLKEIF